MQSFRMREHVRVGVPDDVVSWHRQWIERGDTMLASVGLKTEVVPASDPFFGRVGRKLATTQREQQLKLERVHPITTDEGTAIMSINYHMDHFGLAFDVRTANDAIAHSACAAFGLERITLALFRTHGFDIGNWPVEVRERLRFGAER
jgi:seryl-tRNA synthetase